MAGRDELYGRRVGEFVLRDRIGEGGFGAVYRCEQPALGREAVIKVLHHRLRGNEVVRQRFLREARLASRLDHPYAAHVYAFGAETDGMFWIAMEMVHGTALDRWLRERGPLALETLVGLFERVAEVVHTAHECGIVHRDLKPSNIMVIERAGRLLPKLLDFGIAKMLDETPEPAGEASPPVDLTLTLTNTGDPGDATVPERRGSRPGQPGASPGGRGREAMREAMGEAMRDAMGDAMDEAVGDELSAVSLTRSNATLGSPPYMSPEQWGNPVRVGPRSDLYALGVIAYEALTGRRPFTAATAVGLAELHCCAEVPSVGPGFPAALDPLFRSALAKRIEDRPATALELAAALRTASGVSGAAASLSGDPVSGGRPSDAGGQASGTLSQAVGVSVEGRARRRPWLALGAAAVLAAAAGVTVVLAFGGSRDGIASREAPPPAPPEPPAPPAPPVIADAAPGGAPAERAVAIDIESSPPRADVFRWPSEVKVGVTPWHGELERADGVAVFVIKKRGRIDQRVEVDLRTGGRSRVTLPPVSSIVHPAPPAAPPAATRHKGEPADPFRGRAR